MRDRSPRKAARRQGILHLALAASAVGLCVAVGDLTPVAAPPRLSFWAVTAIAVVVDCCVLRVRFRRDHFDFTMTEAVTALGLYLAAPAALVAGQVLGGVLGRWLLHRTVWRTPFPRSHVILQATGLAIQASLGVLAFHAVVGQGDPLASAGLAAAFLATAVTSIVSVTVVDLDVAATGDTATMAARCANLLTGLGVAVVGTGLALVVVLVQEHRPGALWVVAAPAAVTAAVYGSYARSRPRADRVAFLYEAMGLLQRGGRLQDGLVPVLHSIRAMFSASVAQAVLVPPDPAGPAQLVTVRAGPAGDVAVVASDADRAAWYRLAALPAGTDDPGGALLAGLGDAGLRHAMSVPLQAEGEGGGALLVASGGGRAAFDTDELRLLETLAAHIAVNVANTHLLVDLEASLARLHYQARHDPLTGLGNRLLLRECIDERARDGHGRPLALLLLDLDGFKQVNDSLGHGAGDELLVTVAERLRACLRPDATVVRMGGDEFAVLLDDAGTPEKAATHILAALDEPVALAGTEVRTRGSIGVAVGRVGDAAALLRDADLAMYEAKRAGKGRWVRFEEGMHAAVVTRLRLETDLAAAVEADALAVVYQPIVELWSGLICGMEALLRWDRPGYGPVPPGALIPVAEATGLMVSIGDRILEVACRQLAVWQGELGGAAPGHVSVNVSPLQVQQPDFVDRVRRALDHTGLPPGALQLELTERVVLEESPATRGRLQDLSDLGVRLAIDDFGTGQASLTYLRLLPVDTLKVDRSFTAELGAAHDPAVFRAILQLGEDLGLTTVAQGVETAAQLAALRTLPCNAAQGWLLVPPLAAAELRPLLTTQPVIQPPDQMPTSSR